MSTALIRVAIETAINAMLPAISTAWENKPFEPVTGTPYQKVNLLFTDPDNLGYGSGPYLEMGFFQISLFYPPNGGSISATARADLIRETFKRGTTLTAGAQKVVVQRTPTIGSGRIDNARWMIPVKIRFYSNTGA